MFGGYSNLASSHFPMLLNNSLINDSNKSRDYRKLRTIFDRSDPRSVPVKFGANYQLTG